VLFTVQTSAVCDELESRAEYESKLEVLRDELALAKEGTAGQDAPVEYAGASLVLMNLLDAKPSQDLFTK
jgi:hypothetical protein